MRLFLLPISTRRTLIYCERLQRQFPGEPTYIDKAVNKANQTWATWEKANTGWKKYLTSWGNQVFKRIPYEEWGLKTVPPLTTTRKAAELEGKEKVEVLFPGTYLHESSVLDSIRKLATERQPLHRKRFWWSLIGAPLTAPVALIPVLPNVPFFYLAFRAWSHWKALSGSKHLQFLLENSLLHPRPSTRLDELYTAGLLYRTRVESRAAPYPTPEQAQQVAQLLENQTKEGKEDVMMLRRWNGKLLAERFEIPEMEVEIERAVEQVEASIKAREELLEEKKELEKATAPLSGSEQEIKR